MAMRPLKSEYKVVLDNNEDMLALNISECGHLLRVVLQRRGGQDYSMESVIYIPLSRIKHVIGIEVEVDADKYMPEEREKELVTLAKEGINELFSDARE